ncbi:Isoleucyl-tRNA synthetase [Planifilum fulgidum]|jgi:isoleucyl-tRNA synthetase|uniref:Isoleucine--tRNA ligase n=1 Tax=Planifilum fulgidum TaxID=201973 RepID=A0A1I2S254_9BACL|nr:isoleucine--tRNA ligase [Planifilum fulgidum]MBO2495686.1 isoleucine--tRNA ligase [Bacillota bacterium]MBO2532116.1 isoleucine--tRNA ligase [Thermoactinomycetaceae bacterium]SFG46413.1 Isoleucyl-tRNA synthetase [Planifilum fulgidum]
MDYSQTLNLPKTDFPMRGNLPKREPEIQKWWDEIDIYHQVQKRRQGRPKFVLHDGPPYANGDIHIGHALNKTLKDIIIRFKSLQGYDAPYVPGWDTHGLPIEHAIITKKGIDRKKVDPVEFREMCKEYALSFVERQKEQFKRLGVRGDWENPYLTLRPQYEAKQIRLFGEMARKGYIYRGLKSVYWSPSSETALAEAEVEYRDKRSPSIYVAFPVKDGKGILPVENTAVVIWTTTPWTIPANLAIAVHADFTYTLVRAGERRYLLAEELVDEVMKTVGIERFERVGSWKGSELEGVVCRHPFYDRESPVILGDHVTLDAGTGCVHTAPGHGEEDFLLGQKYGLGVLCPVDEKGRFTSEAPGFEGMFYDDANKAVTKKLEEVGALLKLGFITHQYPHDWRTKKPVIFRATEQWFASIDGFRQQMLEAIKEVKWTPPWGEVRIGNMIAERSDWCISRQRVWGVPLPIFYCEKCDHPLITEETIDRIASIFEKEGSSAWYAKDVKELLPPGVRCPECGHDSFRKETDTMDVWFDSGSSHAAVLMEDERLTWPADLYLEGSDQYRGWFNSSLSTAVATTGRAPYKGVLSHGFTLDGEGRKMSKSLGNTVEPNKVIQSYGADILRLWVASVEYQADVRISDDILKQIAEVYRKIRNTFRFLLGNLYDFDPASHRLNWEELNAIDRYALIKLQRLVDRVTKAYERYEFHLVYHSIHTFCAVFLSQFYLDVLKDRLYTQPAESKLRRSSQTAMYEILLALVKMVSPIIPHTADEVWRHIPGTEEVSVQLTDFPTVRTDWLDDSLEKKWDRFLDLRDVVLKALEEARREKMIGNSLGAMVTLYPSREVRDLLEGMEEKLEQLFIVSKVEIAPPEAAPEGRAVTGDGLSVRVSTAPGEKCDRCWMVLPSVGNDPDHPGLCDRCVETVRQVGLQAG